MKTSIIFAKQHLLLTIPKLIFENFKIKRIIGMNNKLHCWCIYPCVKFDLSICKLLVTNNQNEVNMQYMIYGEINQRPKSDDMII